MKESNMIDYNLLMSILTDTCGMPTQNGKTLRCVFYARHTGKYSQFIIKDLIFFYKDTYGEKKKLQIRFCTQFQNIQEETETRKQIKC